MRKRLQEGFQAFAPMLQGVSFVAVIGFAFWLGQLQKTLTQHVEKLQTISSIVVESNESLVTRTKVLETKLDIFHDDSQKMIDSMEKHLTNMIIGVSRSTKKHRHHGRAVRRWLYAGVVSYAGLSSAWLLPLEQRL